MIKKGYQLKKPLIIYHTTNSNIWSKNINLRLNFELDNDSSLRLIDLFKDTSEKNFLNIFYNFDLKENAILKNYKIDRFESKNIKYSIIILNKLKIVILRHLSYLQDQISLKMKLILI